MIGPEYPLAASALTPALSSTSRSASKAAISSGEYSFVVKTVQAIAQNSATPPAQKLHFTVSGNWPSAATLETPSSPRRYGKIAATTAPAPIKAVCTAYPVACCVLSSMSPTKARNGSIAILRLASRIHSRAAANNRGAAKVGASGIRKSESAASSAPVMK